MATQKRRRYIKATVEDAIKAEIQLGRTPKQIQDVLNEGGRFPEVDIPTLRTIQRIVSETPVDTEVWAITDSLDGWPVIAALGEVAVASNGARLHITKAEAEAICRIANIAPDIPPLAHFLLAVRENQQEVQLFLAFAPWRQSSDDYMYLRTILQAGLRVPLIPPTPTLVLDNPVEFWDVVASLLYRAEAFKQAWGKGSSNG